MTSCPNRHPVAAGLIYCEECGSRVNPDEPLPPPVAVASPVGDTWTCPGCDTSQSLSRFCEACGESNREHVDYVATAEPANTPDPTPSETATARNWTIVASADRDYFDKMQSHDGPDAAGLQFPTVYPPRSFTLEQDQIFIGRRSRSRGIDPDIDLSAAPEDSGVSHAHAAIIADGDAWQLVDVGSSNGTYLNGSTQPLTPNTPTTLKSGDQIHLGAWTTLTITAN